MSSSASLSPARKDRLYSLLATLADQQYQPDRLLARRPFWPGSRKLLFYCLGYIARADGRVTEQDIRYAESLMSALELNGRARRAAIARFHRGRDSKTLSALQAPGARLLQPFRPDSSMMLALCLCHGTQIRGRPSTSRRHRCEDAFEQMGLPFEIMDEIFDCYAREVWLDNLPPQPRSYDDACRVLKVSSTESFDSIKRAYRREVSKVHPDKLDSGLSSAQQALARDQLLRLQQAWELIRHRQRAGR